jgi:hypothetical protein
MLLVILGSILMLVLMVAVTARLLRLLFSK